MKQIVVQRVDQSSATRVPTKTVRQQVSQRSDYETQAKSMKEAAVDADCELAARCIDELLTTDTATGQGVLSAEVCGVRHPSGEAIEQIFQQSAYASVRNIKARIERNVVVLQGSVPTFYLRQLALAVAMKHLPGTFIVDFIEVNYA